MKRTREPRLRGVRRRLLAEAWRGRTFGRALMHLDVESAVALRGKTLDVGGGHRQTYLEFVDLAEVENLIVIDIAPSPSVDVVGSVTKMPLKAASIDTVLCFNVLEHVFDHRAALEEMCRVMKPGAVLYGWVPFTLALHGDPHDYYRYTPRTLRLLLSEHGLSRVQVAGRGDAFLSAYDLLRPHLQMRFLGRFIRVACASLALLTSWAFARLMPRRHRSGARPADCPNGIWFVAQRS